MVRGASEVTFADRDEAGRRLGDEVSRVLPDDGPGRPLVLALPRGGVPVAVQVAERIGGDLDLLLARKIGAPHQPEYGVGAIAEDGPPVFDTTALGRLDLTVDDLAGTVRAERAELARRARRYRGGRPAPRVAGRCVVLVDDGLATGVTARAALRGLRHQQPRWLALAIPVCAPPAYEGLRGDADQLICLAAPPGFRAVGEWYTDFHQLTDEDVDRALRGFASA
ncbi:phosphoribosyltransferase [Paractinoplanes rishiriensis]|uniref:Phosphoribosyltransferase n=1 Tax=Paractinoplanes rishiriensis TaxID=1050105 RepID=A0A919JWH2_9ACTN|nr:phosphoribosyltransferase family protein [Actinoplanes rishiriensis]GIE94549.1 phosphoribosyltransferase [Actinoplanes rishiriensis]